MMRYIPPEGETPPEGVCTDTYPVYSVQVAGRCKDFSPGTVVHFKGYPPVVALLFQPNAVFYLSNVNQPSSGSIVIQTNCCIPSGLGSKALKRQPTWSASSPLMMRHSTFSKVPVLSSTSTVGKSSAPTVGQRWQVHTSKVSTTFQKLEVRV